MTSKDNAPPLKDDGWTLHHGDCLDVLPTLDPVDSVVTDPPYGLEFMGRAWDHGVPGVPYWTAVLDTLKPGGHLLAFGGTRTHHRLMVGIEDAGFEIRDVIMWVYGSGFPKSHNVGKGIDRQRDDRDQTLDVTRWIHQQITKSEVTHADILRVFGFNEGSGQIGHWAAVTDGSQPAVPTLEQVPTLLAVLGKPLVPDEIATLLVELNGKKGQPGEAWFRREVVGERNLPKGHAFAGPTYGGDSSTAVKDITAPSTDAAKQWDGWGSALKPAWEPIIIARKPLEGTLAQNVLAHGVGGINIDGCRVGSGADSLGRWPANLIHDGSDDVTRLMPDSQARPAKAVVAGGESGSGEPRGIFGNGSICRVGYSDSDTSSARFFYCAKATQSDRDEGLNDFAIRTAGELTHRTEGSKGINPYAGGRGPKRNTHPTVKPLALMRYLVRLVTPPGGTVCDPFMGSGSTGKAADLEGCHFVGIEADLDSYHIATQRRRAQRSFRYD